MKKNRKFIALALSLIMVAAMAVTAVAASTNSDSASSNATASKPLRMRLMGGLDQIIKLTGLTADQVKTERQAGKSLVQIAESKNVSQDTLVNAMITANQEKLEAAKASSKITQTQYDKCLSDMKTRITEQVTSTKAGPLEGKGGKFGPGMGRNNSLDVVSELTGLTEDAIFTQLKAGKTLAQIAESKNISQDTLVTALVKDVRQNLDTAKTDGKITQEQYDSCVADLQAKITKQVTSTRPAPGQGHGKGMGQGMGACSR